jgi:16S rRNA processing protein RimM
MRVIVGRVGRPHGIRGEVVIGVRTDEPDLRFAVGATLYIDRYPPSGPPQGERGGGQPPRTRGDPGGSSPRGNTAPPGVTVTSARWHSGQLLVAFAGITDRTAAGELTGSWLSVDSSQLPETPDPDEFRDHELIGLSVRTSAGEAVGVVTDVLHYGQDLLVIRRPDEDECLVPFVKAIVPEVDVASGVLVIDPPPGLLDPAQAE